jgi:hypothetical protein
MATAQYQDDGGPMGFDEEDEGGGGMGFVDATEVRNARTIPSDSCVEFDRERERGNAQRTVGPTSLGGARDHCSPFCLGSICFLHSPPNMSFTEAVLHLCL